MGGGKELKGERKTQNGKGQLKGTKQVSDCMEYLQFLKKMYFAGFLCGNRHFKTVWKLAFLPWGGCS